MVWGAVIGAAAGIGSALIGKSASDSASKAAQKAADEANELAEKQAEARYERAKDEWKIDYWTRLNNYYWEQARTAQLRYIDKQKAVDYYDYGSKLIDSAIQNYQINTSALYDQFVTQEQLRSQEVSLEYSYSNLQAAAQSNESIRQYMQSILLAGQEASGLIEELENQSSQLMATLVNDEALENLGYDLILAESIQQAGAAKSRASIRTAGGQTAERIANAELAKAGAAYQELAMKNQSRRARVGLLNNTMTDVVSNQMGRIAIAMQDQADRIKYTSGEYRRGFTQREDVLSGLIIPSFQLSENQYYRELQSLQLQTKNTFDRANLPYREAEYFDPLKPILGLEPEYYAPTPVYGGAGTSGSSVISAINGAISGINQFDPNFFSGLFSGGGTSGVSTATSGINFGSIASTGKSFDLSGVFNSGFSVS